MIAKKLSYKHPVVDLAYESYTLEIETVHDDRCGLTDWIINAVNIVGTLRAK